MPHRTTFQWTSTDAYSTSPGHMSTATSTHKVYEFNRQMFYIQTWNWVLTMNSLHAWMPPPCTSPKPDHLEVVCNPAMFNDDARHMVKVDTHPYYAIVQWHTKPARRKVRQIHIHPPTKDTYLDEGKSGYWRTRKQGDSQPCNERRAWWGIMGTPNSHAVATPTTQPGRHQSRVLGFYKTTEWRSPSWKSNAVHVCSPSHACIRTVCFAYVSVMWHGPRQFIVVTI